MRTWAHPTELVRASFAFLLEREPKESILSEFDLPVIGRYFPDHESEIRHDERSTVGKPGRVGSPGRR